MAITSQRYKWISFLRFCALLSILFAHFTPNAYLDDFLMPINNFIKYFSKSGVFIFFFCSGYLYHREKGDSLLFWRKKTISIIFPFLIASLSIFLINLFKNNQLLLWGLLGYGNYLWFIPVLLIIFLVFKISDNTLFDIFMMIITFFSLSFLTIDPLNITMSIVNSNVIYFIFTNYLGFFAIGRIFKRHSIEFYFQDKFASMAFSLFPLLLILIVSFAPTIEARYWNFEGQLLSFLFFLSITGLAHFIHNNIIDTYFSPFVFSTYLFHMIPYQYFLLRLPNFLSIPFTIFFAIIFCFLLWLFKKLTINFKWSRLVGRLLGF